MDVSATAQNQNMNRVLVVILLAQFIIVIDTTFMNVSISTLVKDFHTSVTSIQNAITLYTLVMATFMIAGAKFGDIIGRKRAFLIGLVIYAVGTAITSVSPALPVFVVGWSVLEGLGAAIMLPAMMSLIVSNFPAGPPRVKAYAAFAAIAGIAAGVGPIIGGFFTTFLSWRLAFSSELLVAGYIFLNRKIILDAPYEGQKPKFDWPGFVASAIGLATLVEGIVLASAYGFVTARTDVVVAGRTLLNAGQISPTIILVIVGLVWLVVFGIIERHRTRVGKDTLIELGLLKIRAVRAGSTVQLCQNLLIVGVIFSISLYLQMQLGYSAIISGVTLLPLSVMVLLAAALSGRLLSKRYAPRLIICCGFVIVGLGVLAMGLLAGNATSGADFILGLGLVGLGIGVVASQNQDLVMSAVKPAQSNETSGLLSTAQNIGSSLGTSLAGAMIIAVFVSTATGLVSASNVFSASQKPHINNVIVQKAQIVSNAQLSAVTAQLSPAQQQELLSINAAGRQTSLSYVYFGLAALAVIGIIAGLRLPATAPLGKSEAADAGKRSGSPAHS